MKNVIEKLKTKGATLFKVRDQVSDKTILQNDSNKSKAKKSIVEKIKKFYYLYLYEKINKFGDDQEYKDVLNEYKDDLNSEIDNLNEEKQKNEENASLQIADILENNDINLSTSKKIKSISEESDNQVAKIDEKIEKNNDKINSINEKINNLDENVVNGEIEKATQSIADSIADGAMTKENTNLEQNEKNINSEIESSITPKEESKLQKPEQSVKPEGKNINDSLLEISNLMKLDIDRYINEAIEKTREEITSYYENTVLKKYKDETIKMVKAAKIQINNVTKERDAARIEAEQYKSGYDSEREKNNQKEEEIKDKNNQIENLSVENEELKKQLEALTKQNEELTLINHNYQVTVSTILSQGMSNDNVEQNEQEPVQKIR